MAAPTSNGVLRTKLADMKIGDYIKWQYNDATVTTMGTFSGTIGDTELPTFTAEEDFCVKNPTWVLAPKSGYFYFIKVASGLLIADRALKVISKQVLNAANFAKGSTYRCLTGDEFRKYIIGSDLNGTVKANDQNVFHHNNWSFYEHLQYHFWYGSDSNDTSYDVNARNNESAAYTANSMDPNSNFIAGSGYGVYRLIVYRPVMEYVDSTKPTNIFY